MNQYTVLSQTFSFLINAAGVDMSLCRQPCELLHVSFRDIFRRICFSVLW